ncbi:hypothetical protein ACJX0J_026095, partial [Zea mays]
EQKSISYSVSSGTVFLFFIWIVFVFNENSLLFLSIFSTTNIIHNLIQIVYVMDMSLLAGQFFSLIYQKHLMELIKNIHYYYLRESNHYGDYYKSLADTTEVIWVETIIKELGICDNLEETYMIVNMVFHAHTKYNEIDYHFVRETVANKLLQIKIVSSKDHIDNGFTKNFGTSSTWIYISYRRFCVVPYLKIIFGEHILIPALGKRRRYR